LQASIAITAKTQRETHTLSKEMKRKEGIPPKRKALLGGESTALVERGPQSKGILRGKGGVPIKINT